MISKLRNLQNYMGFIKYFKNTSWLFAEKILRIIVGIFVGIWVARYLGPEQFGLFSYAQSFAGLFTVFATLGLDGIVVRELVKDKNRQNELISIAFWLKVIGAFIALVILVIAVNFTLNDNYTNLLVFIIASATIFQSFNVVDMYFQAKVLSKYVVYANVFSLLISSIIKIVFILNEAPLMAFAWVVLFDSFVLAAGFIVLFLKNSTFQIKNLTFNRSIAVRLLQHSWPLILGGIVISIYTRIDQVMIKEMLGNESVGQYAAAVQLSNAWYFIPVAISMSVFPAIINAKKISEILYYERLQKLYNLMVWVAIVIALFTTFLSDWAVNLLYGGQYNQAGSILAIHIWSIIFGFLGITSEKWLLSENLQLISFYRTFFGVVINIILNFILIPKYGVQGAAFATLITQMSVSYIFDIFNNKTKKMFFMKTKTMFIWRFFKY